MLFNSYEFIFLFLPISFFIYFYLLERRLIIEAKGFLVFASLFFYSWWSMFYLPIILSSMLFNFLIGHTLNENFQKIKISKRTLLFGISFNIFLLGYFKYSDFFLENINASFNTSVPLLNLALPLAISFFTFQQIAYLVDSYKQETSEYDFLNYALFVTFFPQLIAGPIVHHKEMMPQFLSKYNFTKNNRNIISGIFIFSMGLFKKLVIADHLAVCANIGFDEANVLNLIEAWMTSLSYTFQLYFDFSAYTDMAIGTALLFNIKLPTNFNSPYKAKNIQEFWRRWHITLSRFLKEYVYIPLGGNRHKTFRNILATFILAGIWHGAGWTFIFWGFLHGIALSVFKVFEIFKLNLPRTLSWFITFNFVNLAWVFFRAENWDDAIKVLSGMFGFNGITLPKVLAKPLYFLNDYGIEFGSFMEEVNGSFETIFYIVIAFIMVLILKNSNELVQGLKVTYLSVLFACVLFLWGVHSLTNISEFLYFNF